MHMVPPQVSLLVLFLLAARAELARLRPALRHARDHHADLLRRRATPAVTPPLHHSRLPHRFVPREPVRVYGGAGDLH